MTVAALALPAAATAAPSPWAATPSAAAALPAADSDAPLRVTLEQLTPGYLPARGRVELSGTVTNTSDERWRAINVYAFVDEAPLTSSAEVAGTADIPEDAFVGGRITEPGTFVDIGGLAPGQTASYSLSLRRDEIPVSAPGVYWFGVHALGNTDAARDLVADGRARTLLPLVPPGSGREQAAVVVPVRHAVRHARDGRIRFSRRWARDLSAGGRLRELLDLGTSSGEVPVTWLVDPAVPDAVSRLVAGNPSRTLAAPRAVGADAGAEEGEESPTAEPTEPGEPPEDSEESPPANVAAEPGSAWLERFTDALAGAEVLALPYGDLDVAAALEHAPRFHRRAVRRAADLLAEWDLTGSPTVAPPAGTFPGRALSRLEEVGTVLLGDGALGGSEEGEVRAAATVAGTRVLFTSEATAEGGPAPGDPLDEVALRQRFLAEAAVRLLFHDRAPLVLRVPDRFAPDSPSTFWGGLAGVPWLELTDTASLGEDARRLDADALAYPAAQELLELDAENFEVAERLVRRGATLDAVLPEADEVADQTLDQALTSLSYAEQQRALEARVTTARSVEWIDRRLGGIRIRAPRGVTFSSASGEFAATVTNRLDQPVLVRLQATGLGDIEVEDSDPIELAAGGRRTVLVGATAGPGVQYVQVQVTDEDGTPLGASQRVAIRSAEVSQVIWLILGTGVGLLFVAIGLRLVRRLRRERGGTG